MSLMLELADERNTAVLLITHDLGVVAGFCDTIQVMYAGSIVERGTADEIFHNPQHPYTWGMLGSMTRLDEVHRDRLNSVRGAPPSLINPPNGCRFAPRCDFAQDICVEALPILRQSPEGQTVACHRADELDLKSHRDGAIIMSDTMRHETGAGAAAIPQDVILRVNHLVKEFPIAGESSSRSRSERSRQSPTSRSRSNEARLLAWWGSPVVVSRPPPGRCCACWSRRPVKCGSRVRPKTGRSRSRSTWPRPIVRRCSETPPGAPDRVPGSICIAESPYDGGEHHR